MKILSYVAPALALAAVMPLVSCGKTKQDPAVAEGCALYVESVRLIRLYSDSIRAARDSASVIRLDKEFERQLTELNFRHPVDTDLEVSEAQNDTLIRMNGRYVFLRDSLLEAFSHHAHLATDTVETQSEAVGTGGD